MNIVIPMAGLGNRFKSAGYTTPKPLIPIVDKPMYAWAVDSLPLDECTRLIFVLLRSEPAFRTLKADIHDRYSTYGPLILDVPNPTEGQAATVLRAKEHINNRESILIHNTDTAFTVGRGWVRKALGIGADGALLVFRSKKARWSYSRESEDGWVVEVREKRVVSPWASTGTYWFRRGSDFVRLAERRIAQGHKEADEYYVAPLFNELIGEGSRVINVVIDRLLCFGTPEDLQDTLRDMQEQ